MCRTYDSATQTQGHGHVIYPSFCVRSISPKPFFKTSFIKLNSYVPLSETVCRAHDPATLTQGHRSRSRDLSLNLVSDPYLLNPQVNFS